MEKEFVYTPEFIDRLSPGQIFVFGSNVLGYHMGGASRMAYKQFGAVWGQAEGLQGQSYAIPTDFGKDGKIPDIKPYIDRFVAFAKQHQELFFFVIRIGCGLGGYSDREMAQYFKDVLDMKNVALPRSFVEALLGKSDYNIERFVEAQDSCGMYDSALREIRIGRKMGHWIWYIFPQLKGLGHSYNSEFYGIEGTEEAKAYLNHEIAGHRLREITECLLQVNQVTAQEMFGFPDVLKVQSCMTLFDKVSPNDVFVAVLDKYYGGNRCEKTLWLLSNRQEKSKNRVAMKRLIITKDFRMMLEEKEVKMEPLNKAVYLLFLNHPEGIVFKTLPDCREELTQIYSRLRPNGLTEKELKSITNVTDPLSNSINEKCSRIRQAFSSIVDAEVLHYYVITGKSGEAKRITLPQNMIIWE